MGWDIGKTLKGVGTGFMGGGALWGASAANRGGKGGGGGGFPAIPKFDMKKTEDFIKQDPRIEIGGGDSAISRRFSGMKARVGQQANAQLQDNTNALTRRFASQGAAGSGAQIKAEMMAQGNSEAAKNDALLQVEGMEAEAMNNRDLAQADMDFKQRVFSFERGSKMHELDLAERQQQQDAVATEINARVAKEQMKPPKQGIISTMLGDIL
jgi:hypothetical protein